MGFGHFSSLAASLRAARRAFLFFNRSSFQCCWRVLKGPLNKKRERHKRKCNLNSKHSSVMRQWVTAMGAQTLKATFKSLHATLGMWASNCWRNIRLQAAAWEVCGIQSESLPLLLPPLHQFNYTGRLVISELPEFQIISLNETSQGLLLLQIKYDRGSLGNIQSPSLLIFAPVGAYLRKRRRGSRALSLLDVESSIKRVKYHR